MAYQKVGEPRCDKEEEDTDFDDDDHRIEAGREVRELQPAGVEGLTEKDTLIGGGSKALGFAPAATAEVLQGFLSSGKFMRLTILVAVTLQNTGYALVRRYSKGYLMERYSTSSALLAMELVKLALSMFQIVFSGLASDVPEGTALSKYLFLIGHSWKMLVPAVIYLVMNILGFVALGHLDASTFSIIAQMKARAPRPAPGAPPASARPRKPAQRPAPAAGPAFSSSPGPLRCREPRARRCLRRRSSPCSSWGATCTCASGAPSPRSPSASSSSRMRHCPGRRVARRPCSTSTRCASSPSEWPPPLATCCSRASSRSILRWCASTPFPPSPTARAHRPPRASSFGACSGACLRPRKLRASFTVWCAVTPPRACSLRLGSGSAEQVLKSKSETYSVWDRNFQLAFWSSLIYAPIMIYDNPTDPFHGWSIVTLGCAATGALGGVLVALSIKCARPSAGRAGRA